MRRCRWPMARPAVPLHRRDEITPRREGDDDDELTRSVGRHYPGMERRNYRYALEGLRNVDKAVIKLI